MAHEPFEFQDIYDKSIELNPNYALAYNNRGITKELNGDSKGAKKDFKKYMELPK